MTKEECYQYMYAHPGVKMRHEYYSPEEYIYINEQGNLITEEGYNMGGRLDEFWSIYQEWEDGWELAVIKGSWESLVLEDEGSTFGVPFELCYDTPITNGVSGYLSEEDVNETLDRIAALEEPVLVVEDKPYKVIRDGKVAVLYSSGFGSGWYNSHYVEELIFHPEIVKMVEEGRQKEIDEDFCAKLGYEDIYCGGASGLEIKWVEEGKPFYIHEYDGAEHVVTGFLTA